MVRMGNWVMDPLPGDQPLSNMMDMVYSWIPLMDTPNLGHENLWRRTNGFRGDLLTKLLAYFETQVYLLLFHAVSMEAGPPCLLVCVFLQAAFSGSYFMASWKAARASSFIPR
jgi:hypothetical protein